MQNLSINGSIATYQKDRSSGVKKSVVHFGNAEYTFEPDRADSGKTQDKQSVAKYISAYEKRIKRNGFVPPSESTTKTDITVDGPDAGSGRIGINNWEGSKIEEEARKKAMDYNLHQQNS